MYLINLLHRADESQKGRNSCPGLQPCFIGSGRVGVSQSLFLSHSISLAVLFYCSVPCCFEFCLQRRFYSNCSLASRFVGPEKREKGKREI